MIIANTTICVDYAVEQAWQLWMQTVYLPMLHETGCLAQARLFRIQTTEEQGGASYALQLECRSEDEYSHFVERFQKSFDSLHHNKYGNHFVSFTTLLRQVQ